MHFEEQSYALRFLPIDVVIHSSIINCLLLYTSVRCLIMKSFLEIEWKNQGNCKALFPEEFLLGAFMQGLNDPVHHKDFGLYT